MRLFVLAGTLLLAAAPGEEPAPRNEWTLPAGFVVAKDTGALKTRLVRLVPSKPGPKRLLMLLAVAFSAGLAGGAALLLLLRRRAGARGSRPG